MWDIYKTGTSKITDDGNYYKYKNFDNDFYISILLKHTLNQNKEVVNIITTLPYKKI